MHAATPLPGPGAPLRSGRDDRTRLRPLDHLLLALAALAILLPGLTTLPPVDRDESRYAQATSQMLETHDFIDVRFQDQPRYLQPAGIYWLQAAAVSLTSSPEARQIWAYRLPSTVAAVLSVLLTASIGAMLFGRTAGIGAGVLLAASVLLGFEARQAKIDATLLCVTLVAQWALLRIYLSRDREPDRPKLTAAAFWLALGAGLMLKGPIIGLIEGGTVLGVCALDRRWRWLRRLHAGWGVLLMLAVALPWFTAIGLKTHGAFFDKAVKHNLLGKVGAGEQAHGEPPGYYLALFTLTFWPGSLAAACALPFAWRERATPAVRFLAAWVVPTWVLYEGVATKLPHYALPWYPALACLGAGAAVSGMRAAPRPGRGWWVAGWAYGVLWGAVGLLLAALAPLALYRLEGVVSPVVLAVAAVAALLAVGAGMLFARSRAPAALVAAGVAAFAVAVNTYALTAPRLGVVWLSPRIAAAAERLKPCPALDFASSAFSAPSLVFLTGGRVKLVAPAPAADYLAAAPACRLALVGERQEAEFRARLAARGLQALAVGEVRGVNYSTGKRLALVFLRAAPTPRPNG